MLNRPLVLVGHSKHMFKVELHFSNFPDVLSRIKFKSIIPVLRTAEKSNMAIIDTVQLQ